MKKTILVTALLFGFVSAANAAPIVIDDFNGTSFSASAPLSGAGAANSSAGYARTVDATTTGTFTDVGINTLTTPGVYSHSQGAGVFGTSQINYALGGLDLDNDANAFRIQLVSIDLSGFFGVTVDGVSVSLSSTAVIIANGGTLPSYADILFSSFAGVNWDSVSTVSLFIDGSNTVAMDATLDNFGTVCSSATASGGVGTNPQAGSCTPPSVPEPAMLSLLGLGFASMGLIRRRRKA